PHANLLWKNSRTREISRQGKSQKTSNVRIEIIVEGVTKSRKWTCGLEFDYANPELIYCRPLRTQQAENSERMSVPEESLSVNIAFLPPMSGLASNETRLEPGAVNVKIGEGRTADVLRNLCWRIWSESSDQWESLVDEIHELFGVSLDAPNYIPLRGEIEMSYQEGNCKFDLSSSGRGLQQVLLLLAYMRAIKHSVILLDEPDAHLEILRQREICRLISQKGADLGIQIIAASHSEVILNEAADGDRVIAFVGKPHRIGSRFSQVRQSLAEIGWEDYFQAEQKRWVLYLEGSTDLSILQALAERLHHQDAVHALKSPFVRYVRNEPNTAAKHFFALREAVRDLKGIALFDRMEASQNPPDLNFLFWKKREIENYLCFPETLENFIEQSLNEEYLDAPLLRHGALKTHSEAMSQSISRVTEAIETMGKESAWSDDIKASDDFLVPVFRSYYKMLDLPNIIEKSNFHKLAKYVPESKIDSEIAEKLDVISEIAKSAELVPE
ncbi:MAG: AAA family ATPase, partial [Gammaproteobacteria bacterium]|nr:AAA family ATPase [Gammaproteobacteria bacterium]